MAAWSAMLPQPRHEVALPQVRTAGAGRLAEVVPQSSPPWRRTASAPSQSSSAASSSASVPRSLEFSAGGLLLLVAGRRRRQRERQARRKGRGSRSLTAMAAAAEAPTLDPLQRLQRSLRFYVNVIPVLGQYVVRPWLHSIGLEKKSGDELYAEMDEWGSQKLLETLLDLGGFYVKTGQ
ncbi:unnamed protein product, partial [Polarella glacialis]